MGVSISYRGDIDDPAKIDELIADMKIRCRALDWPCEEVDQRVLGKAYRFLGSEEVPTDTPGVYQGHSYMDLVPIDDRVRGVRIQPPNTETVYLTFNRAGHLCWYQEMPGQFSQDEKGFVTFSSEPGYYLEHDEPWVKTTGAIRSHILLVALFRYIQDHYISNLKVRDDTDFWETDDVDTLVREHRMMGALIGFFQKEDVAKALLEMSGLVEDVENVEVEPLDPHIEEEKPDWTEDWGVSAGEN
jgi:hypothetical protein